MSQILYFHLGSNHEQTNVFSADRVKTVTALFMQLVLGYPSGFPTESGRIQQRMDLRWQVITQLIMSNIFVMGGGLDLTSKEFISSSVP